MSSLVNVSVDLRGKEFLGKIVPNPAKDEFYDFRQQGRYRVHIPELMPHLPYNVGIWCKNHTHKWRITPSDVGEYGQYFPLQAGTYVIVQFYENDINTGYIDRINSDYKRDRDVEAQDCTAPKPAFEERDEQYIICKTPKKWSSFYINEDTYYEPNTIYLIYNRDHNPERRTVHRIDESGHHFWTRDNLRERIKLDHNKQVDGNETILVKGYSTHHIWKRTDRHYHTSYHEKTEGVYFNFCQNKRHTYTALDEHKLNCKNIIFKVKENVDKTISKTRKSNVGMDKLTQVGMKRTILAGVYIAYDAPMIYLNCGVAQSVSPATPYHPTGCKPNNSTSCDPCAVGTARGDNVGMTTPDDHTLINPLAASYRVDAGYAPRPPQKMAVSPGSCAGDDCPAHETYVRDLGPNETQEYNTPDMVICNRPLIVGKKCNGPTDKYNNEKRDNDTMCS